MYLFKFSLRINGRAYLPCKGEQIEEEVENSNDDDTLSEVETEAASIIWFCHLDSAQQPWAAH